MKDKIFYACEGFIIGLIGHKVWNDVVIPIVVAAVCAVITAYLQHVVKKWLNGRDYKKGLFKQNGRK